MISNYDVSIIKLSPSRQPTVPTGDDRSAASNALNAVLEATDLAGVLRDIADRFVDDAPASAAHVLDLSGAMAGTVLEWIARWPS